MDPFGPTGELTPEEQAWATAIEGAYAAVDAGDAAGLPAILAGHPRFANPFWSLPLLEYAIESGKPGVVAALLAAGTPANEVNELGWSPLMVAAHAGNLEIARLLLAAGADPNVLPEHYNRRIDPDSYGRSALYLALTRDHKPLVELLTPITHPDVCALARAAIGRQGTSPP